MDVASKAESTRLGGSRWSKLLISLQRRSCVVLWLIRLFQLSMMRTRDKQWQRDAFTTFIGVPWHPRELAVEAPTASSRRPHVKKSLVQQHGETPGCPACLGVSSQYTKCRERFERLINPNATDVFPAIPSAVEDPSPAGGGASAEQQRATHSDTSKHVRQTVGMKRGAEEDPTSSAKSAHTRPPPL